MYNVHHYNFADYRLAPILTTIDSITLDKSIVEQSPIQFPSHGLNLALLHPNVVENAFI